MKDLASTTVAPMSQPPAARAPTPITMPDGGVFQAGVATAPRLVTKVEPQFSGEASQGQVDGTVVLTLVVGSDGVAHDIAVSKSLRPDLDRKAIEAVSQWKFQPGEKDGKPVNVMATVEVNFRRR